MHDLRAILKTGMVKERYSSGESCRRRRVLRFSGGRIRFSTIAVMPPAAIPDESRFFTHSGANCRICGCCETPRPTASDRAIIRIARRFSGSRETIRTRRRQWCRTSPTWRRRAPVPDMLHKTAYRREQAEHNQHQRDDKSHIATGDAGQLNDAVVLTETGIRERIKYR